VRDADEAVASATAEHHALYGLRCRHQTAELP
jgi:hypothetical protein